MIKIKKVICPSCGRITEKKEYNFLSDVINGSIKEWPLYVQNKDIQGIEFCAICR